MSHNTLRKNQAIRIVKFCSIVVVIAGFSDFIFNLAEYSVLDTKVEHTDPMLVLDMAVILIALLVWLLVTTPSQPIKRFVELVKVPRSRRRWMLLSAILCVGLVAAGFFVHFALSAYLRADCIESPEACSAGDFAHFNDAMSIDAASLLLCSGMIAWLLVVKHRRDRSRWRKPKTLRRRLPSNPENQIVETGTISNNPINTLGLR